MTGWSELAVTLGVAFAGGVFGASLGGVTAFAICGILTLLSVGSVVAGQTPSIAATLAWGPFFGPQAAFVGAVGAAAFAASRGLLESGRDVLTPLGSTGSPATLLVGGAWGLTGQVLFEVARWTTAGLDPSTPHLHPDAMALAVALTTLAVRGVHGGPLLPAPAPGVGRWRPSPEDAWLPWQSGPAQIVVLAVGVAVPAAWIQNTVPSASGVIFALSAASLLLFTAGRRPPVTLHMALMAEAAAALWGGWTPALAAAIVCGLLAELFARLWLVRGDTHVDPPAWAIAVTGLLMVAAAGMIPPAHL